MKTHFVNRKKGRGYLSDEKIRVRADTDFSKSQKGLNYKGEDKQYYQQYKVHGGKDKHITLVVGSFAPAVKLVGDKTGKGRDGRSQAAYVNA